MKHALARKPRTMSEKTRAFLALRGDVFPREGDLGIFSEGFSGIIDAEFSDDKQRTVEVRRVSATGLRIWTRFVHPEGQRRYGEGMLEHLWKRSENDVYTSSGFHAPIGEIRFRRY